MFAYRGEYVSTTPGLFTLYAIADEGSHYKAPLPMVKSLDGFSRTLVVCVLANKFERKKEKKEISIRGGREGIAKKKGTHGNDNTQ